jgi:GNAT superfamily N-acetyltransferase
MQNGYNRLPPGKIAAVVTYLEMGGPPSAEATPVNADFAIRKVTPPDVDWYRGLYREIGEPWLWFSRLRMSDDELRAILHDSAVDVYALSHQGQDGGLLEFDRRSKPDIELSFFGVAPRLIGKGAGRALLGHCLPLAWAHNPRRIWLHTCTLDHPGALGFYRKAGFVAYERAVEIADDPRLTGDLPVTAAPDVPIIQG